MTSQAEAIDECAPAVAATRLGRTPGRGRAPRRVPRGDEGREVADRPAGREDAAGAGRHPDEVGDPAQRLVLGVDRAGALEPRARVDRRGPDDEVEHHGGVARGARDEGEVARVVGRQAGRREVLGEHPHRGDAAEALGGDRLADPAGRARPRSSAGRGAARSAPAPRRRPSPHPRAPRARCACSPGSVFPCTAASLGAAADRAGTPRGRRRCRPGRPGRWPPAPRARPRPR